MLADMCGFFLATLAGLSRDEATTVIVRGSAVLMPSWQEEAG